MVALAVDDRLAADVAVRRLVALRMYQRLTGLSQGSVLDPIVN